MHDDDQDRLPRGGERDTSPWVRTIPLPPSREALESLRAGDEVRLTGVVYTARDATHERLLEALDQTGELPFGLAGEVLFYAGPTPPVPGHPAGSVGPTTAKRMDAATPRLLAAGIRATIGKGRRSEAVREACVKHGAAYFVAVGGAAAYLGTHVTAAEPVAWPELGTEALVRMTLDDFPAFVAIDVLGNDLYALAPRAWRHEIGERRASGNDAEADAHDGPSEKEDEQ